MYCNDSVSFIVLVYMSFKHIPYESYKYGLYYLMYFCFIEALKWTALLGRYEVVSLYLHVCSD